jgi:hypothetical protein
MPISLNLYRMSCKACLFAGRLSMSNTDDNDDTEETIATQGDLKLDILKSTKLGRVQEPDYVRNFSCIAASSLTPGYS